VSGNYDDPPPTPTGDISPIQFDTNNGTITIDNTNSAMLKFGIFAEYYDLAPVDDRDTCRGLHGKTIPFEVEVCGAETITAKY